MSQEIKKEDMKINDAANSDSKNHIEKNALEKLKLSAGDDVINFAYSTDTEWICVCGTHNQLNRDKNIQNCSKCHRNRDFTLKNYSSPFLQKIVQLSENIEQKKQVPPPENLGFNFGAFFITPIWLMGHGKVGTGIL